MAAARSALFAGIWLAYAVAAADERHAATFVLTSDLDGALAPARCDAGHAGGRHLGHLAASIAQARVEAEAEGRTVAAVVHMGDLTGPAAVGRYLLEQPGGAARLAAWASRLGLTHAIIGNSLIDRGPEQVGELLEAYQRAGLRFLNATLACENRTDCQSLKSLPARTTIETGALRIGLVGGTGGNVLTAVDPELTQGLSVDTEAFEQQARAARDEGAELVVVAGHWVGGPGVFAEEVALSRTMESADLVLANQVGELPGAAAAIVPEVGAAIGASGASETEAVRLDVTWVVREGRARVTSVTSRRVVAEKPEPGLDAEMRALVGEYCAALDRPLPARATRRVGMSELMPVILDVLRRESDGEVAVFNLRGLEESALPLEGAVSTAQVYAALPFDDVMVRAEMTGARLRALWKGGTPAQRKLYAWAGIEDRDGVTWVNGRPLDDLSRYAVATTDFLARGGDGFAIPALEYKPARPGRELQLRDALLRLLSDAEAGTKALAGEALLDLSNKLRWSWSTALGLTGLDTRRSNDAGYPDSRLKRDSATTLRAEATGRVDGDARDHSVRLTVRARYAKASVAEAAATETEDQFFTEALYRLRAVKRMLSDAFWAPVPYVASTLDTEFVQNPTAAFRHEELGGTVGIRLLPMRPLEIKLGVGARREMRDPAARTRLGLETGYDLPRFSPTKIRGLPVDVESGLDYFVSDLSGTPQHEGRLRARLLLPLGGPLSISAGIDAIALKSGDQPFAFISDASLGITARFDGARQQL